MVIRTPRLPGRRRSPLRAALSETCRTENVVGPATRHQIRGNARSFRPQFHNPASLTLTHHAAGFQTAPPFQRDQSAAGTGPCARLLTRDWWAEAPSQRAKPGSPRQGRPRPGCPRSPAPTCGRRLPLATRSGTRLRPAARSGSCCLWRWPSAASRKLERLSRLLI